MKENLYIAAIILGFGSFVALNIYIRFFGPCSVPVAQMPGWCVGFLTGH